MRYLSIEILRLYAREKANIGIVVLANGLLQLVNVTLKHPRDNVSKKANIGILWILCDS